LIWTWIFVLFRSISGRRTEVNGAYLSEMANRYRWILLASDWYGMSVYDLPTVVRVLLAAPEEFAKIPHTSVQGKYSIEIFYKEKVFVCVFVCVTEYKRELS
jgi:hypothetical protein